MEDLESLILQNLRALHCDIEGITSIAELNNEMVVEAVVRCLWLICPQLQISSYRLPPSMTARFRLASTIATAIKGLGYKNEVGYETFLYGSEVEIRRLLIFLIEKLPKEIDQKTDDSGTDFLGRLKREVSTEIRSQLSQPWLPWYCKRLGYVWDGRFWHPPTTSPETVAFHSCPMQIRPVSNINDLFWELANVSERDIPASIFHVCNGVSDAKVHSYNVSDEQELAEYLLKSTSSQQEKIKKPKLPPKPRISAKPKETVSNVHSLLQSSANDESTALGKDEMKLKEIEELRIALGQLSAETSSLEATLNEYTRIHSKLCQNVEELKINKAALEGEIKKKGKAIELIPSCNEVVEKLQEFLAGSNSRMEHLQSQWYEVKRPLDEELKHLELAQGHKVKKIANSISSNAINISLIQNESQLIQDEIADMNSKIAEINMDEVIKTKMISKLQKELESMEEKINRSYFTKRILEVVANIRKQKEQIEKILDDTREAQRDITSLTGKLERTFIATDELIFKDAKINETGRRVYKQVASLHEMCGEMVKSVQATGQIKREIREIEDLIDSDTSRSLAANLEKLLTDYYQMRQENEVLTQRLQQLQK